MADRNLYIVVTGKDGFAAGDTLDVALQHSDEEAANFATVAQSGAQPMGAGQQISCPYRSPTNAICA